MAIVKLTSSGKAIQFIDDDNNIYQIAKSYLIPLLMGTSKYKIATMSRMPYKAPEGRFPKSEVWGADDATNKFVQEQIERQKEIDVMSKGAIKQKEKQQAYIGNDEW